MSYEFIIFMVLLFLALYYDRMSRRKNYTFRMIPCKNGWYRIVGEFEGKKEGFILRDHSQFGESIRCEVMFKRDDALIALEFVKRWKAMNNRISFRIDWRQADRICKVLGIKYCYYER